MFHGINRRKAETIPISLHSTSRYSLSQLRIRNVGGTAAWYLSGMDWNSIPKRTVGNDSDIPLLANGKDNAIARSCHMRAYHSYWEQQMMFPNKQKPKKRMEGQTLKIHGQKHRIILLDITHLRFGLLYDAEEPKTMHELQQLPDRIRELTKAVESLKPNHQTMIIIYIKKIRRWRQDEQITDNNKELNRKLHDAGDITEQKSDEIFSAAYNLFNIAKCGYNLITALTSWYNEVYNQLKNGKDGNFVSTLPLVPIEPGINDIVGSCLNLLPWHKKVRCAGLPAGILPISRLPWKPMGRLPFLLGVADGITLYRKNRRINITTLISDRAALFQKVNVKADLNEYVGIDAESSAAKTVDILFQREVWAGWQWSFTFLSWSRLHAIMKITEI